MTTRILKLVQMSTFKPGDVAKEPSNSIVQSKNLEKNLTPEGLFPFVEY